LNSLVLSLILKGLDDALTPITDALNTLKQAHPYFDQIVQAAIAKFGRVEEETV